MATAVQLHARENNSLSADAEKRALVWMAERLPSWVNSDHLTVLGFVGMIIAGLGYWVGSYNEAALLFVVVGLTVNWFGDSMDGTLARVRNKLRPRYGYYVDHVVDVFGVSAILGGLAVSRFMSPTVAAGLFMAYMLMSIDIYLATHALGKFKISFGIFGATELRILLAVGSMFLLTRPEVHIAGQKYLLFDLAGVVGIVGLVAVALFSVIRNTVTLYRQETNW
jgi:phosphatidylglycerophosphate synthase